MASRVVLAAVAGLLAAAVPATAGPTVYVRGRVVDDAGRPVAGARVSFEVRPDLDLYSDKDCPVKPWLVQCRVHAVSGVTDAAGRYRLPVRLSSFLGTTREHHLVVTDRLVSGAVAPGSSVTTMYFPRKPVDVADIRVWRGRASFEPAGPLHRTLHVDPMAEAYGAPYTTGPVAELLQGADVAWRFGAVVSDRRVDARIAEAGTTAIRAWDRRIASRLPVTYTSPAWPVTGTVSPASRGAACFAYGRSDAVVPLSGCRHTDGRLAAPIAPAYHEAGGRACTVAAQCDHPFWLLVDLRTVQPVGALSVRGCVPEAAEASVDGVTFVPYVVHDVGEGLLGGPPLPARYVRVDLRPCGYATTEVSVFAP